MNLKTIVQEAFPMNVVMQVSHAMQTILTSEARRMAVRCRVIQRERN